MIDRNIDAAVADGRTKVVMPVSPMNGVVAGIVHGVGDVGNVVVSPAHSCRAMFGLNGKATNAGGGCLFASGDDDGVNALVAFPSDQALPRQIDLNPALVRLLEIGHAPGNPIRGIATHCPRCSDCWQGMP